MRWLRLLAAWLPVAVLISILPVYACYLIQPAAGYFHDDGVYLVNALSLASGHGYRTISLPDELFQTKYPFLYPAVLAILWKLFPVFPANLLVFKSLSLCATALWAYLSYRLALRETGNRILARWIAVIPLTFPWVVLLSTTTMPETLFALVSTASLLAFQEEGGPSRRRLMLGSALAAAAFLLRSAGSALVFSWLYLLLKRKEWRSLAIFCLIMGALAGPWVLWQTIHPATNDLVGSYYTKLNYQNNSAFSAPSAADSFRVAAVNAVLAIVTACPLGGTQLVLLSLAAGLLCLVGLAGRLTGRTVTLPVVWFVTNAVTILGMMFGLGRYQVPLFAVSLILCANGALLIFHKIGAIVPAFKPSHAFAALLLLFAASIIINEKDLFRLQQLTRAERSPAWALSSGDSWQETMHGMTWLREHTPRNSVIMSNSDPGVFLYADRKAIRPFNQDNYKLFFDPSSGKLPLGPPDRLKMHLIANDVSYIFVTPMRNYPERQFFHEQLASLVRANPDAFRLEKKFGDPEFYILKVDRSKL
jgi:hypothetical protein